MKTIKILPAPLALLSIGLTCLGSRIEAATANTFQLQMRSAMNGGAAGTGPQGWVRSSYSQHGGMMNQSLQIRCRGLATNQVYHLMASWGTNGELMHVSDFTPNRAGTIMMQYMGGTPHHYAGTNNPGQGWGMMGGWTNHMSWVIFPPGSTNWCNPLSEPASMPQPLGMMDGTGDHGGMGAGGMTGSGGSGTTGGNSGMGHGFGMGGMGVGWPMMTDWWEGMTNWWPMMANWCWDYTNMWNAGSGYASDATNWWGSMGRGGSHMMPMPTSINPVPALNGLIVMDGNLQPVLSADLATPDTFVYQTRCALTNLGVLLGAKATLQASATGRATHFALSAIGLAPSTTYYVTLNQTNRTPRATDQRGRLQMRKLPNGVPSMRGIGSVSIEDQSQTTILEATLPPN